MRISRSFAVRFAKALGRRALGLILTGSLCGFALFFAEICFVLVLQRTLALTGILTSAALDAKGYLTEVTSVRTALLLLCAAGMARALLNFFQAWMQSLANTTTVNLFRRRTYSMFFFHRGERIEQLMERNQQAMQMGIFVSSLQGTIFNLVLLLSLGLSMLRIMPLFTIVLGATLALVLYPIKLMDSSAVQNGFALTAEFGKVEAIVFRSMKNLLLLRIYGTESHELDRALNHLESGTRAWDRIGLYTALKFFLPQAVGVLVLCAILYIFSGQSALSYFAVDTGSLVTYLYIFIRLVQTVSQIQLNAASLNAYRGPVATYLDWWEGAQPRRDALGFAGKSTVAREPFPAPLGWAIRKLRFGYENSPAPVLKDIDLAIEPGSCFVIFGPSGVGKSTLLSILIGALKPQAGEVLISSGNGAPRDLFSGDTTQRLGASLGYVGPEAFIVEGTLRENLVYGSGGKAPSDEAVREALRLAECGFVDSLAGGLDYRMTEQGEGLSAGQKQRLALARGLLRNPKALILDEATSNLDQETEARIIETLLHLKRKLTIVAVSHRPSIARIADQILRM